MKIVTNFKIYTILTLCIVFATSCEKSDPNTEAIEINTEEGFISSTGNNDATFDEESENVKVLLHMSFDSSISEAESQAQFDKAIAAYEAKNKIANKMATNSFTYKVTTLTANGKYDGTDGKVHAKVRFFTSDGTNYGYHTLTKRIDNPNKNDFEKGNRDHFYLEATLDSPVCWASIDTKKTSISLQGTDGWGVLYYQVWMNDSFYDSANGSTIMRSYPGVVLDNISSNGWDTYKVSDGPPSQVNQDTGVIYFNCN